MRRSLFCALLALGLAHPAVAFDFKVNNHLKEDLWVCVWTLADDGTTWLNAQRTLAAGTLAVVASSRYAKGYYFAEPVKQSGLYWGRGDGADWFGVDDCPYLLPFSPWPLVGGAPAAVDLATTPSDGLATPTWVNMYWGASLADTQAFEGPVGDGEHMLVDGDYLLYDHPIIGDSGPESRTFACYFFKDGRLDCSVVATMPFTAEKFEKYYELIRAVGFAQEEKGTDEDIYHFIVSDFWGTVFLTKDGYFLSCYYKPSPVEPQSLEKAIPRLFDYMRSRPKLDR